MPLSDKLADKVKALYIQHLEEHFGEKVKFDTVTVEPAVNSEGRDFFRVTVVYDDEHGSPAPLTKADVQVSLADPFEELGLPLVMLESYVPKSEYPLLLELRANPPPWDDADNPWEANENEDWDEAEWEPVIPAKAGIQKRLADKVKALYIQHLEEHFGEKVKFDTVLVEPAVNSEGRDFFRVIVVYDDEYERPAPLTKADVQVSLMDPFEEMGLPLVMLESYMPKSEYPLLLELRANPPPWDDEDNPWEANESEDWDEDEE